MLITGIDSNKFSPKIADAFLDHMLQDVGVIGVYYLREGEGEIVLDLHEPDPRAEKVPIQKILSAESGINHVFRRVFERFVEKQKAAQQK